MRQRDTGAVAASRPWSVMAGFYMLYSMAIHATGPRLWIHRHVYASHRKYLMVLEARDPLPRVLAGGGEGGWWIMRHVSHVMFAQIDA